MKLFTNHAGAIQSRVLAAEFKSIITLFHRLRQFTKNECKQLVNESQPTSPLNVSIQCVNHVVHRKWVNRSTVIKVACRTHKVCTDIIPYLRVEISTSYVASMYQKRVQATCKQSEHHFVEFFRCVSNRIVYMKQINRFQEFSWFID